MATKEVTMKRYQITGGTYTEGNKRAGTLRFFAARNRATKELRKDSEGTIVSDIIDTEKDLHKIFGGGRQFRRLHNTPTLGDSLESKTIDQLKSLAEEEEIDLGGATKKSDILSRIQVAVG